MWNTVVNFTKMGRAGEGQEAKGLLLISGLGTTSLTSVSDYIPQIPGGDSRGTATE
jgi:hypothetical protein